MSKVLNKAIDNIYSLTPLQEGMLFHAQREKDSTNYILQNTLLLRFEPDSEALTGAVHALSRRYDALRTAIVYEGMAKARQVVLKERVPELRWVDLRHLDRAQGEEELIQLQDREVSAGFDLQKQPLLRFCCVALKGAWKLIWTMHHIIVDGWCMSLLRKDLLRYYEYLRQGMSTEQLFALVDRERVESTEYSRYVKWLEKQEQLYGRPIIFNLRYKEIAKILHNIEQHTDTSYHTNPLVYKGMEQLWKSCEQYCGQQMKEERRHKV